jgi:hypothetical protein
MATRRMQRARPELRDLLPLMHSLEGWGVDVGGAPAIVQALATGSGFYVDALVYDVSAWRRYHDALTALRDGRCPFGLDDVVIGALAWTYVDGTKFVEAVRGRVVERPAVVH